MISEISSFEPKEKRELKLSLDHLPNGLFSLTARIQKELHPCRVNICPTKAQAPYPIKAIIIPTTPATNEAKQEIANVFARIVCEDELTDQEKDLYFKISEYCGLPDPVGDSEPEDEEEEYEDDEEEEEEEIDEEDCIVPAFFVVNYHGMVRTQQSEAEDWDTLGKLLAKWIRADRVEIVRFTPPLNALTRELELNNRHLVFMVSRNGYDEEVGDNMPATILYGGGYPIYGNVVFALETDDGYEIEGFRSRSLLSEALDAVNDAVDGLLRFPD